MIFTSVIILFKYETDNTYKTKVKMKLTTCRESHRLFCNFIREANKSWILYKSYTYCDDIQSLIRRIIHSRFGVRHKSWSYSPESIDLELRTEIPKYLPIVLEEKE